MQRRYNENLDRKVHKAPLAVTARKYVYVESSSMTTSVAEHLEIEYFNKLMPPKTGPSKEVEVTMDKDGG